MKFENSKIGENRCSAKTVRITALKILTGVIVLFAFIYTGIPFEIQNPIVESIVRIFSFALIFFLLYLLYKQARKFTSDRLKHAMFLFLSLLSLLFILGALWNDIWVSEKNERNSYYTFEICKNRSGTKILRQMMETSGSIHDYRDRLVLYEFDKNNRISINTNIKNYNGPWIIENKEDKSNKK